METGRQCLLAILDSKLQERDPKIELSSKTPEFQPNEILRSLLYLPKNFLCDEGYLFETIFNRSPAIVISEALQLLLSKCHEKDASSLGEDQINLAIKQLRLDFLCQSDEKLVLSSEIDKNLHSDITLSHSQINQDENKQVSNNNLPKHFTNDPTSQDELFRIQILIELIRLHIISKTKGEKGLLNSLSEDYDDLDEESEINDWLQTNGKLLLNYLL